jgi:hypothetical protein
MVGVVSWMNRQRGMPEHIATNYTNGTNKGNSTPCGFKLRRIGLSVESVFHFILELRRSGLLQDAPMGLDLLACLRATDGSAPTERRKLSIVRFPFSIVRSHFPTFPLFSLFRIPSLYALLSTTFPPRWRWRRSGRHWLLLEMRLLLLSVLCSNRLGREILFLLLQDCSMRVLG